ncbi:iron-siderophore ABC transporter substrate-binding protein [Amnibacterium endophyticum]|uniref:Iron-siderophore ABC transporter substrate-binding protein n=1 Tax=Amnibacterium endophyticum TaxID=2109337 RepID=A0ABW4LKV9_9MICO
MRLPRLLPALATAGAALLVLAGCSGATAPGSTTPSASSSDGTTYPITIPNAFGETTIEKKPTRVATVAWSNQEVPLALGVVPVGMPKATFGDDDGDGVLPWVEDRLKALGAKTPTLFDETSGIDFEAVADTRPDVILAAYSGLSQDDYDTLSKIAPVVAYPDQPWTTSLDDMIVLDSEGMGMKAQGEALVASLDEQVAAAAEKQPSIAGRSVAFVSPKGATDLGSLYVYTTHDPRAAFFEQLGMTTPEVVKAASAKSDAFYTELSAEASDRLDDVDVLVLYGSAETLKAMQADPLLGRIPAVKRGSVVVLGADGPLAASANPSPLSIGWGIDDYVERLAAAAQKV